MTSDGTRTPERRLRACSTCANWEEKVRSRSAAKELAHKEELESSTRGSVELGEVGSCRATLAGVGDTGTRSKSRLTVHTGIVCRVKPIFGQTSCREEIELGF